MTPIARKPEPERDRIDGELEWFLSLVDALHDGDTDLAIDTIENAIALLRREREKL